ncbi:MAG: hydrolase 1, exosortase A system-associated [Halioglobus sp.]
MTLYREQAVLFECGLNRLFGIVATPEAATDVGVLILVGGPQYRVGSHRQFTLLARSLAEAGIASLRFDFTGMGDSEGPKREFDSTEEDIFAAIDALFRSVPTMTRVVLWGLCDAASSAMMFGNRDPRVAGMILLNPWVHNGEYSPQVKLAHYYRPAFSRKEQWRRLFSGKIRLAPAFKELARDALALIRRPSITLIRRPSGRSYIEEMLYGLQRFRHDVLIVLSDADLTAREFSTLTAHDSQWHAAISSPAISVHTIIGADHTFSEKRWKDEVSRLTIDWVLNQ